MTTQGRIGLIGSETSACSGWLSIGSRSPTMLAMTLVWPAVTQATFGVRIVPRVVSTPVTAPVLDEDVRHLALLDDVDAHRIGGARIAPDDRVVAVDAAGALQRRADHRIARASARC